MTRAATGQHRFVEPGPRRERLRWMATAVVSLGAIAGPLLLGGTPTRVACALQGLLALALLLWLCSRPNGWCGWWVPVLVVALGAAQLAPLPPPVLQRASPLSFSAQRAARELTDLPGNGRVSIDASRTQAALRRCLTLALVVLVTADLAREAGRRRLLLCGVAFAGVVVLLTGLVAGVSTGYKVLGLYDRAGHWKVYQNPLLSGYQADGTGTGNPVTVGAVRYISRDATVGANLGLMVNQNHYAACVGLTAPVVLGLLAGWGGKAFWQRLVQWSLMALMAGSAIASIVFQAHSRGGLAAVVVAAGIVAALAVARSRSRGMAAFGVLGLVGAIAAAAVWQLGLLRPLAGRLEIWKAACEMFAQSPWLGVGLGDFGAAFPAFRSGPVIYLAHSVWLECVAEGGIAGLALVLLAASWLAWRTLRPWKWTVSGPRRNLRLALAGSVLFAACHGSMDHGIQIPGTAWLCAVLIGALLGDVGSDISRSPALRGPIAWGLIPATGILAVVIGYGAAREVQVERLMMPLRRALVQQRMPEEQRLQALHRDPQLRWRRRS